MIGICKQFCLDYKEYRLGDDWVAEICGMAKIISIINREKEEKYFAHCESSTTGNTIYCVLD